MCISKNASIKEPSMFMYAFFKNDYNTLYKTFYSMFDEINIMDEKTRDYKKIVIDYDEKIKQFIELRKERVLSPIDLTGGKYIKRQYRKKTRKQKRSKLHKKKSKKSKRLNKYYF
jgi:hypothetical protein